MALLKLRTFVQSIAEDCSESPYIRTDKANCIIFSEKNQEVFRIFFFDFPIFLEKRRFFRKRTEKFGFSLVFMRKLW
ncbi:MAG TPA: hypothetical protein DDY70_07150 [Clostridiales bacterium]|nr:hypothetical protein [Clostridiales bacterium]